MRASSPRATIGWRSSTTWSAMRSGRVCRPQCEAISLFAAGLGEEAKQFADTSLRHLLPAEQEAQVRLSIASMFGISPDVRADNAQAALALPDLPKDLRAWLEALVLHNLMVAGRT